MQQLQNWGEIAQSAVHMVMKREVNGSNPGGVKLFSTRLSFESNLSDMSRFMLFKFLPVKFFISIICFISSYALWSAGNDNDACVVGSGGAIFWRLFCITASNRRAWRLFQSKWSEFFYSSKNLNFIGALSFFLRSVHTFSWFLSRMGVVILVTPKQEMERKSEWFCGVMFFRSNFKVEWENGVWTEFR